MPDDWDYSTNRPPRGEDQHHPPILTYTIAVMAIFFTAAWNMAEAWPQMPGRAFFLTAHLTAEDIWNGRYGPLFSTVFLHGNPGNLMGTLMHIGFNLSWFLQMGRILEATLHPVAYWAFLIGAAVVGSGAELAFAGQTGVGLSGVVYAMFGLMWAGRREKDLWRYIATPANMNLFVGWGILCIVATYFHFMAIANWAHAGGFFFGLACGSLFIARRNRILSGVILAALVAITIMSVTWLPWSGTWYEWKAGKAFDKADFAQAARYYRRAYQLGVPAEYALENEARAEENQGHQERADQIREEMAGHAHPTQQQPTPDRPRAPDDK